MKSKKPTRAIVQQSAAQLAFSSSGYGPFLEDIKSRIRTAQVKASLSVNSELIQLYWDIGRSIVERQESGGWGVGIVNRLAQDLQRAFPGMEGFSPRNLRRMRAFYRAYPLDDHARESFGHGLWLKGSY